MFHINDEEKPGRKAALQKLMSMMGGETAKKLAGIKKPGSPTAIAPVDGSPAEEGAESPAEEAAEGDAGGFCQHCGKPR